MSAPALSFLEMLHADIKSRLFNDPFLANVNVLEEKKGVTDADLAEALGTMIRRNGKKGALILVSDMSFTVPHPGGAGPQLVIELFIRGMEKPLVNRAPVTGTLVTVEAMAMRIVPLIHDFQISDLAITMTAKAGDVITYKGGEREIAIRFETILQLPTLPGCAYPFISGTPENVTITCATAGAIIYYTTDGSTPGPDNAAARIYGQIIGDGAGNELVTEGGLALVTAPNTLSVEPGTLVRAVAFKPPLLVASNLAAKHIR